MKKIGVVGASGRTGQYAVMAVRQNAAYTLHSAIVSPGSSKVGSLIEGTTARYSGNLADLRGCDVVIDFSNPDVSVAAVQRCAEARIPILVATTGHSLAQMKTIRECADRMAVGITPNTSVGAAAMCALIEHAKDLLGSTFDIEMMEIHHRQKKDAPSGTAKSLLAAIEDGERVMFGREGQREAGEIGVASLRGGDVVGDHTVYFLGNGERVELTHRVSTREVFGAGAVRLAEALMAKPAGIYSARDLLESFASVSSSRSM